MNDLLITEDGDLYLSPETGDVQVTESVMQAITVRLRWFLGEWRMNTDYGMPYYSEVFIKNPSLTLFESRIRKEILTVDEVESVEDVKITLDHVMRGASVKFTVTVKEGSETTRLAMGESHKYNVVTGEVRING